MSENIWIHLKLGLVIYILSSLRILRFLFFFGGGGLKFMDPNLLRKRLKFLHQVKISANRFNNDTVTEITKLSDGDSFSLRVQVIRGSTFFVHTKFGFAALMCSSHSGMGWEIIHIGKEILSTMWSKSLPGKHKMIYAYSFDISLFDFSSLEYLNFLYDR